MPTTGCATYSTNNMATPLYMVRNADPGKSLFWLQDTFMELPSSVPMDLASLIHLHVTHGWLLEGLIHCWHDLQNSGCSLADITLEDEYAPQAIERIWQLHREAHLHEDMAINAECSRELAAILEDSGKEDNASTELERELLASLATHEDLITHPDPDFYLSLAHTWRWFWTHAKEQVDNMDLFNLPPAATFIATNEATEGGIPLDIIPHGYRHTEPLRSLFVAQDRTDLIPGFGADDGGEGEALPF